MRTRELARTVIAHDNECVVCVNTRDADGPGRGRRRRAVRTRARTGAPGPATASRSGWPPSSRTGSATEHTKLRDDEDFWSRCNEHFTEELLADLALSCALWVGMGRSLADPGYRPGLHADAAQPRA